MTWWLYYAAHSIEMQRISAPQTAPGGPPTSPGAGAARPSVKALNTICVYLCSLNVSCSVVCGKLVVRILSSIEATMGTHCSGEWLGGIQLLCQFLRKRSIHRVPTEEVRQGVHSNLLPARGLEGSRWALLLLPGAPSIHASVHLVYRVAVRPRPPSLGGVAVGRSLLCRAPPPLPQLHCHSRSCRLLAWPSRACRTSRCRPTSVGLHF